MDRTSDIFLKDMEIYEKIVPLLDNTITFYGKQKFNELFKTFIYDPSSLKRRQGVINAIRTNQSNVQQIKKELYKIKDRESDLKWLFYEQINEITKEDMIKKYYFGIDLMDNAYSLTISNYLKIAMIFIEFIVWGVMYYFTKKSFPNISVTTMVKQYYNTHKSFVEIGAMTFFKQKNIRNFVVLLVTNLYFAYRIYSYGTLLSSTVNEGMSIYNIHDRYGRTKDVLESCKKIFNHDIFMSQEKQLILGDLNNLIKEMKKNKSFGGILMFRKNREKYIAQVKRVLGYIGLIDSFINTSSLVDLGFVYPEYEQRESPFIEGSKLGHPLLSQNQVRNDVQLGNPHTIILTGPNTSGKSSYMRTVALNLFLGQTLGLVFAKSMKYTPFAKFYTYMNIPDSIGRESLFEAEVNRCLSYQNDIDNLPKGIFSFAIIDELFTGTNPDEGLIASESIIKYFRKNKQSIQIISTHFLSLGNLSRKYSGHIKSKKFVMLQDKNGFYYPDFRLIDGISSQKLGIQILRQKGYNNEILKNAEKSFKVRPKKRQVKDRVEKEVSQNSEDTRHHVQLSSHKKSSPINKKTVLVQAKA